MEGTTNCLVEFVNRVVARAAYDTLARKEKEKIHGLIAKLFMKVVLEEHGLSTYSDGHKTKKSDLLGMDYYKTRMVRSYRESSRRKTK